LSVLHDQVSLPLAISEMVATPWS